MSREHYEPEQIKNIAKISRDKFKFQVKYAYLLSAISATYTGMITNKALPMKPNINRETYK